MCQKFQVGLCLCAVGITDLLSLHVAHASLVIATTQLKSRTQACEVIPDTDLSSFGFLVRNLLFLALSLIGAF